MKINLYRPHKIGIIETVLAAVAFPLTIINLMSPFIYFYSHYWHWSVLFLLLCLACIFGMQKYQKRVKTNTWFWIGGFVLLFNFSLWNIPKWLHSYYFPKQMVCFEAKTTYKSYSSRNESGYVNFDIDWENNALPKEIMFLSSIHGIPDYQYDTLPPVGSSIRICGELSKVGFQYKSIEAVK